MLKMKLTSIDFRGDTIVEVMVVLAVLGLAIGISYSTANRSLLDTDQAEENSQATEYAQGELEDIRYLAPNSASNPANPNFANATNIFKPTTAFCITTPTAAAPIITATAANCMFGSIPYHVVIYNCDYYGGAAPNLCTNSVPAGSDSFIVYVTWPDILGQGTDSVTLSYRVHSS